MIVQSNPWKHVARLYRSLEERVTEANAETTESMYQTFGITAIIMLDAATCSFSIAILAVYTAQLWQSEPRATWLFQLRLLFTPAIALAWLFVLKRWFGYLKWPKWWVFPYFLLVLLPWTWFLASRIGVSIGSISLFLLQLPVTVSYVWRAHVRNSSR